MGPENNRTAAHVRCMLGTWVWWVVWVVWEVGLWRLVDILGLVLVIRWKRYWLGFVVLVWCSLAGNWRR